MKISAPQNDRLNLIFVKDINIKCSYFDWLKNYDLKCKFMIFSPVANLMHHLLGYHLDFFLFFIFINPLSFESYCCIIKSVFLRREHK